MQCTTIGAPDYKSFTEIVNSEAIPLKKRNRNTMIASQTQRGGIPSQMEHSYTIRLSNQASSRLLSSGQDSVLSSPQNTPQTIAYLVSTISGPLPNIDSPVGTTATANNGEHFILSTSNQGGNDVRYSLHVS